MLARITSVMVAGLVLFAACDSDDEIVPTDEPSQTPTPTVSHSNTPSHSASPVPPTLTVEPPAFPTPTTAPELLEAVGGARTRWEAAGIGSYEYDLEWSCFCGRPDDPVRIVVRESELLSVKYSSGADVLPGPDYDIILLYSTIDRVFQQMDSELQTPGRFFQEAAFDSDLGFPTRISSNSSYVTDAGMNVIITNFEVLP